MLTFSLLSLLQAIFPPAAAVPFSTPHMALDMAAGLPTRKKGGAGQYRPQHHQFSKDPEMGNVAFQPWYVHIYCTKMMAAAFLSTRIDEPPFQIIINISPPPSFPPSFLTANA